MNKIAHAIVLGFFGVGCWLTWVLLQLPRMVKLHGVELNLPAFTRFCMGIGPLVLAGLGVLATGYCIWIWVRKEPVRSSWIGFLATATGSLVLVILPIGVAVYLPLVNAIQHIPVK